GREQEEESGLGRRHQGFANPEARTANPERYTVCAGLLDISDPKMLFRSSSTACAASSTAGTTRPESPSFVTAASICAGAPERCRTWKRSSGRRRLSADRKS